MDHMKLQAELEALREENAALRASAQTFADLAERLAEALREALRKERRGYTARRLSSRSETDQA